jgi:hypothetical protein
MQNILTVITVLSLNQLGLLKAAHPVVTRLRRELSLQHLQVIYLRVTETVEK